MWSVVTHTFAYLAYNERHIFHRRVWYRTLSLRCVRAMRVFDVRASSSPLYATFVPNFAVAAAIAELTRGENCYFDAPGTEAFASEKLF